MGCNIHLVAQIEDDHLYDGAIVKKWDTVGDMEIDRDYPLYAAMADVRNRPSWGIEPVAQPRGLPTDNAWSYPFEEDHYTFHHASWLTPDEFEEAIRRATTENHTAFALLAYLRAFESWGRKARIVFCFDN